MKYDIERLGLCFIFWAAVGCLVAWSLETWFAVPFRELYWLYIMGVVVLPLVCVRALATAAQLSMLLGILFTFIGVSVALLAFDPDDITTSIRGLLGGLKTAFYSSVLGISVALLIRFFTDTKGEKKSQAADWENKVDGSLTNIGDIQATVAALKASSDERDKVLEERDKSLHDSLTALLSGVRAQSSELSVMASTIGYGLAPITTRRTVEGSQDSLNPLDEQNFWLRTVLKELQTANEREAKKSEQWEEFLVRQSQQATEQMAEAMTAVVEKLEATIREQLGESFVSFRHTVGELDSMMTSYRDQLQAQEESRNAFSQQFEHVVELTTKLAPVLNDYSSTVNAMQSTLHESVSHQIKSNEAISQLGDFSDQLHLSTAALVDTNKEWLAMAGQVNSMHAAINEFLDTARGAFNDHTDELKERSQMFSTTLEAQTAQITETMRERTDSLQRDVSTQIEVLSSTLQERGQHFAASLEEQNEKIHLSQQESLKMFKDALSESRCAHDEHIEAFKLAVRDSLDTYKEDLVRRTEHISNALSKAQESVSVAADLPYTVLKQADETIHQVGQNFNTMVDQQLRQLQSAMEIKGQNSAIAMGEALSKITMKVADDYQDFIDSLDKFNKQFRGQLESNQRMLSELEARRPTVTDTIRAPQGTLGGR